MLGYIGSKKTLLPFLEQHILPHLKDGNRGFADIFSGTGCVAQHFGKYSNNLVANDMEYYSFVINNAMLKSAFSPKLGTIIDALNQLEGIQGLITQNFAKERMFFTEPNAKRMDAVRQEINELFKDRVIDKDEYYFLLASFLVALDKVANTASVYGAYLKHFKKSALKDFVIKPIHNETKVQNANADIRQCDALELIKEKEFDVVYIDPPYNGRQYSANYSLLNYAAIYDSNITIQGKAGLIKDYFKSSFCSKSKVLESFEKVIGNLKANTVFISYNNEGLIKENELKALCEKYGNVQIHVCDYKRFASQKTKNKTGVNEFLYEIQIV